MDQGELIETLTQTTATLRIAMQGGNVSAIETAAETFCAALDAVKSIGGGRARPELREAVLALNAELEQARAMACLLADMTGQMHEMVAARSRDARQGTYSRQGLRTA
jgi:hypothetical protein